MPRTAKPGFTLIEVAVVLVIVIALGAGAAYEYRSNKDATTTPTVAATADPTAGWQTFSSTAGGYTVKYPKGWFTTASLADATTEIKNGTSIAFSDKEFVNPLQPADGGQYISIDLIQSDLSLDDYVTTTFQSSDEPGTLSDQVASTVDGNPALKVTFTGSGSLAGQNSHSFFVKTSKGIVQMVYPITTSTDMTSTFDKMASTLTF